MGVLSCLSYNRESTPEANISKTNPSTVMHCGSLSQGFAECLQKETKQVTDGSPGLPVTSGTSKRDRDAGRTAQITPNTNRARCCSCCRSPQEDADQREDTQNRTGSGKLSHEITGDSLSSVKDGESFNENTGGYEKRSTGGCGRFLLERILSLLFPLWFKKLHPSNLLNICFSELSFRLCSALLRYNNLGSPSSSH